MRKSGTIRISLYHGIAIAAAVLSFGVLGMTFKVTKHLLDLTKTMQAMVTDMPEQPIIEANTTKASIAFQPKTWADDRGNVPHAIIIQNKSTSSNKSTLSMSACLIVMDDNHFLVEWLAYHYQVLPLRRLIVAVDPNSQTSPLEILNRYSNRSLMNVTVWHDPDYLGEKLIQALDSHNLTEPGWKGLDRFKLRQRKFIVECLKRLKDEDRGWVYMADTDEFVVPNVHVKPSSRIANVTFHPTVVATLQDDRNQDMNEYMTTPCQPMRRLKMGTRETSIEHLSNPIPPQLDINQSNLLTFRYRYPEPMDSDRKRLRQKCMIDLSRVRRKQIVYSDKISPHRLLLNVCPKTVNFVTHDISPFVMYHYAGTWEQIVYRRGYDMAKIVWDEISRFDTWKDDTPQLWLPRLVQQLGPELVKTLLEGTGNNTPLKLKAVWTTHHQHSAKPPTK